VIQRSRGEEGWHKDLKRRASSQPSRRKNFLSSVNYLNPRFPSFSLSSFLHTPQLHSFQLHLHSPSTSHFHNHPSSLSLFSLNMVATRTIFSALTALTLAASSSAQLLEDILGINLDLGLLQPGGEFLFF